MLRYLSVVAVAVVWAAVLLQCDRAPASPTLASISARVCPDYIAIQMSREAAELMHCGDDVMHILLEAGEVPDQALAGLGRFAPVYEVMYPWPPNSWVSCAAE